MPSRWITFGIVMLWAATTLWMVYRENWEHTLQPSPFAVDRADEVGSQKANWSFWINGKHMGLAQTNFGRPIGATLYESKCEYLQAFYYKGLVTKLSSSYGITPRGEVRNLSCQVTVRPLLGLTSSCKIEGGFANGLFLPLIKRGLINTPDTAWQDEQELTPLTVSSRSGVFNLFHPSHKIAGLSEGQSWRIPLLNPLALALANGSERRRFPNRFLEGTVRAEPLVQETKMFPTWRINLQESGGVRAHIWARVQDGLVLQQQVEIDHVRFLMRRIMN